MSHVRVETVITATLKAGFNRDCKITSLKVANEQLKPTGGFELWLGMNMKKTGDTWIYLM